MLLQGSSGVISPNPHMLRVSEVASDMEVTLEWSEATESGVRGVRMDSSSLRTALLLVLLVLAVGCVIALRVYWETMPTARACLTDRAVRG